MNCVACKQPNAPERNYCGGCGTPLARYCSLCGFRNGVADRFCGGCGTDLGALSRGVTPRKETAPVPPEPNGGAPGAGPADMAALLEAAQESAEADPHEADVKVSQDDIDSLFGE